jgi:hypothetical protein
LITSLLALRRIKIARSTVRMPDDGFMSSAILMGNDVSGLSRCASRRATPNRLGGPQLAGVVHDSLKCKHRMLYGDLSRMHFSSSTAML